MSVMHTEWMFDQKAQAEAMILEDLGSGNTVSRDMHGVDWDHHKYILEVRPAGEDPFRIETKAKVPIFSAPQPGDLVMSCTSTRALTTEIRVGRSGRPVRGLDSRASEMRVLRAPAALPAGSLMSASRPGARP